MTGSVLSALESVESIYDQLDPSDILRVKTFDVSDKGTFCRMVAMGPLTTTETYTNTEYSREINMQYTAAVALALSHLNAGDGSVIPELEDLKCDVKFTLELADTGNSESQAASSALSILDRSDRKPCAFIGSPKTDVTEMLATLTTLREYPQISPISSASRLSDPEQFRFLARLSPSEGKDWDGPDPLLEFLYMRLDVRHLVLAYEDEEPKHALIASMVKNAEVFFPDMHLLSVPMPQASGSDMDHIQSLVGKIESARYRFVLAAFNGDTYVKLFEAAVQHGIAGIDCPYTWIWANLGVEDYMKGREFDNSSPIFQALAGSLLYSRIGSSPGVGRYSAFASEWERLTASIDDIEYLRSKIPENDPYPREALDLHQDILAQESAHFSLVPLYYDSAILMGLSACERSHRSLPSGPEHFFSLLNTTFIGASGPVVLSPENRARSQDTVMYQIWNFVQRKTIHGTVVLDKVQIASYANRSWTEPNEDARIVFADTSTNIPPDLPPVVENRHYVGSTYGRVGFVMMTIVLMISFAFSKWTIVCRDQRIVRASQPIFLHLICIGTGMMGISIAVLGLDDESIGNMDLVCSSTPILLCLGWCFSFSAILAKTLRINMIFRNPRFKRIRVTPKDVMQPMLILLLSK